MSRRVAVGCFTAGMLIFTACQPKAAEFTSQDEATLRGMFEATPGYFKEKNYDKWAGQFSEDASLQPPNGSTVTGRVNLIAWGKSFPPMDDVTFSKITVRGEGNVGYGTSSYVLKLKGMAADSGKQLVVFRRPAGGAWAIVAGSFNSDIPLPAAAPSGTATKK